MQSESLHVFQFGEFLLDPAGYELRRSGARVRLPRQPMELLLLLARHAGELVTRDEIAAHLWGPDVFVDVDAGIQTAVFKIRQALGDGLAAVLETVPGKGYRLTAAVQVVPRPEVKRLGTTTPLPRHNLPAERTPLIGRERELEELPRLIARSRLVTLTGSGGVGKTRLALRAAAALVPRFADGVWLVDLGAQVNRDSLPELVVRVLRLHEEPGVSAISMLHHYFRDRETLLVLDTCEHMIAACAPVVDALLATAPGLRVLATSREALATAGEVTYRVPSLSVPADSSDPMTARTVDAVRLFMDRAEAVEPTFRPTANAVRAIARICRRCDGVPLAIELAAGRSDTLTPDQIEARLQSGFRILTGGPRTAVTRQRTLEATLDWSYQLLTVEERLLLNRLAVFPEAWTIEAAEGVCAGEGIDRPLVVDLLSSLVKKSLVAAEPSDDHQRRYRLLDSVRDYAFARLGGPGDAERLRDQHFAYFYGELKDSRQTLLHGEQIACLARLRDDQQNVRAALDWGLRSTELRDKSVELVAALFWYWIKRSLFAEGRSWLERALTVAAAGAQRGWILIGLSRVAYFQGCLAEADSWSAEALTCVDHPAVGEGAWIVAFAFHMQGFVRFQSGEYEEATRLANQAFDAVNLRFGGPLMMLGNIARVRRDGDTAQQLYDEAIAICRLGEDAWALGIVLPTAAGLRIVRGQLDEAQAMVTEALTYCQQLEDWRGVAWCIDVCAALLAARGDLEGAARAWGTADALLDRVRGSLNPEIAWIRNQYLEPTRLALGNTRYAALHDEGRIMSVDGSVSASAVFSADRARARTGYDR